METALYIGTYIFCIIFAIVVYQRKGKEIGVYIEEVAADWPNFPKWINYVIFMAILPLSCIALQVSFLFESLFLWITLLFIIPFFYLPIKNGTTYNLLTVTTFAITMFYGIALFFNTDKTRDIIGEYFIRNYEVSYTTEYYTANNDYGTEHDVNIAHINTGNQNLDFFMESMFPLLFRSFTALIIITSLLFNISMRKKNKMLRSVVREDR